MSKYAEAAVSIVKSDPTANMLDAWQKEMKRIYPNNPAAEVKGCPKHAFLGLCEKGLIKGVPAKKYSSKKSVNATYACKAAELIKQGVTDKNELWHRSCGSKTKDKNGQMDIVIALFESGLLK